MSRKVEIALIIFITGLLAGLFGGLFYNIFKVKNRSFHDGDEVIIKKIGTTGTVYYGMPEWMTPRRVPVLYTDKLGVVHRKDFPTNELLKIER